MVVVKEKEQEKIEEKDYLFLDMRVGQFFKIRFEKDKEDDVYMRISAPPCAHPFNAVNLITGRLASFAGPDPVMLYNDEIVLYQDKFVKSKW